MTSPSGFKQILKRWGGGGKKSPENPTEQGLGLNHSFPIIAIYNQIQRKEETQHKTLHSSSNPLS